MPTNKDFKRLVRGRMHKTGESYTAARAHLIGKRVESRESGVGVSKPLTPLNSGLSTLDSRPQTPDYARIAGMTDAAVKAKTGCTWERWVYALDRAKAYEWPHPEIAKYVHEKYKVPSWWTQMVTVGYERIKGLRVKGQRRDGGFEANKSRTFRVPLAKLYRAFNDKRLRARWLGGFDYSVRSATREKYFRMTWADRTLVEVGFTGKGATKSQVAIQHGKFPDQAAARKMKEFWAERLEVLGSVLLT